MEAAMLVRNDNRFLFPDARAPAPDDRERFAREVIFHARVERAKAMRALVRTLLLTWPRKIGLAAWRVLADGWTAYRRRRQRRQAVAELRALDDRELKDIGLRRGEIEWVVYGPDATRRERGKSTRWLEAAE
jgi:uncharacterized protein YjiS (DUF1127 family)